MTETVDAIVIGAGHNGLVCSTYLARAGMRVICLEARDAVGGMGAMRALRGDYRFPGLAHTAWPLSPRIRRELRLDRLGYSVGHPVETIAIAEDGRHLTIGREAISGAGLSEQDRAAYPGFMREFLSYARALRPLFESKPPRLKELAGSDRRLLARLGWNLRIGLGRESMYEFLRVAAINVHDVLDEAFEDDRIKGALATEAVLGSAMGPRTPGTVLTWLQQLQGALNGARTVRSGDRSDPIHALARAAEAAGVSVRPGARVDRILLEEGTAVGVRLTDGETLQAKTVVSGVDPRHTLLELVGARSLDAMFASRVTQIRGTGTVAKLHLALSGQPAFTGLDEALLGNRLVVAPTMQYVERAFNHSKYGQCSEQPILEILIPSLHNAELAPKGHHVMSVNVAFAPYDVTNRWDGQKDEFVKRVMTQLDQYAPGIKSLVVDHELLNPSDIEQEYGAVRGHWHHGELALHQSFMMRPVYGASRYDTPVDGLFLCSAGCHPGGGLTGFPGRSAARRVLELGGTS